MKRLQKNMSGKYELILTVITVMNGIPHNKI